MRTFIARFFTSLSAIAVVATSFATSALPVAAAGPLIGTVSPANARADVAVTLSTNVNSASGIKSCNLYIDLVDEGSMSVMGSTVSRTHTFTAGGSHTAFVFCRENNGAFSSGPYTAVWVEGTITQQAPGLPGPGNSPAPSPSSPPVTEIPLVTTPPPATVVLSGSLVKLACPAYAGVDHPCKAVYFIGGDGKRHVFPNGQTYNTWFADFSSIATVDGTYLSGIVLGKNVTYRPGVRMVKFQTENKVYAVSRGGILRWINSEALARSMYGDSWNTQIDEIPDAFYTNYSFGMDINTTADYNPSTEAAAARTVDEM